MKERLDDSFLEQPSFYRRNALAFAGDMALFQTAISFIGSTAVLPSFIVQLTSSEVIVGLVNGLTSGAWLLPQLFVASAIAHRPRKKPLVVRGMWFSRPILLLMALGVWLWASTAPGLALGVVIGSLVLFFVGDAIVAVPWFDLLARGLPPHRRGRIMGIGQILGGLGGIAAGMFIRYVLSDKSPWRFPTNFAFLFSIGAGLFIIDALVVGSIYEPESSTIRKQEPVSVRQVLGSLPTILRQDRGFLALIAVRLLGGFVGVASSFYILYATRQLGLPAEDTGLLVSTQVVGTMVAGLMLGIVQDRWGPLVHMRLSMVIAAFPPLLSLLAGVAAGYPQGVLYLYLAIYFCLGLYMGSMGWPAFNWIMEYASEERRPLYLGLLNTLGALNMVAPALGGWTVRALSYVAVFVVALCFALASLALSATIPDTRRGSRGTEGAIGARKGRET